MENIQNGINISFILTWNIIQKLYSTACIQVSMNSTADMVVRMNFFFTLNCVFMHLSYLTQGTLGAKEKRRGGTADERAAGGQGAQHE
jgi:hypothetical protein